MRKAIIGAGFETGIAEDISRAGVWLCQNGFLGADQVLEVIQSKVPETTMIQDEGAGGEDDEMYKNIYILSCGPSIVDLLLTKAGTDSYESKIHLKNVDNPLLLVALVASAAQEHNVEIEVCLSGCEAMVFSQRKSILPKDISAIGTDVSLILRKVSSKNELENTVKPAIKHNVKVGMSSISVSEKTLQGLARFAAKTYVPASEASRLAGAGAGLTDND